MLAVRILGQPFSVSLSQEEKQVKVAGKDKKMKQKRIISYGANSKIYHKPGCRYVKRILPQNQMTIRQNEAKACGCRVCRYCNSMNYHYLTEEGAIDFYERKRKMDFKYIEGVLYVKTSISCWKIVYSRKAEMLVLYHRNRSKVPVNFDKPQYEEYHRQEDVPYRESISSYLYYIHEHDKYREAQMKGEEIKHFTNKKYQKIAKNNKRKHELQRVNYLFRMLESQNSGYKELSYC